MTALQPVAQSIPRSEVGILGSFEVYRDGVRLPTDRWQNRISRLFKLLVTAPDHRMSRDDLIEILWPATAPQAGASNLRLLVHLLRQALAREESAPEGRGVLSILQLVAQRELLKPVEVHLPRPIGIQGHPTAVRYDR